MEAWAGSLLAGAAAAAGRLPVDGAPAAASGCILKFGSESLAWDAHMSEIRWDISV